MEIPVPSWKAGTAFCCCHSPAQGLWNNVGVQLFNEERGNVPLSFVWSKHLPEWECCGSARVLKVCSFPGQERAPWESVGILVSTLSWLFFLWLELHPSAGALSSLGPVCSKPWVLSAGEELCWGGWAPPVSPSICPQHCSLGAWGSREHLPPFSVISNLCPLHRDPNFSLSRRPFGDFNQTQKIGEWKVLWCSLRERQQLNYHGLFTPQLTWNFLA